MGSPKGRALTHSHPLPSADSSLKKHTLYSPTGRGLLYYSCRKKEDFSPCPATTQPMRNATIPPRRSHLHPEVSLSSSALLLITSPPYFLLCLYKATLSSFVLCTCLWFPVACRSKIEIALPFLINSFLLVKELAIVFLSLTLHDSSRAFSTQPQNPGTWPTSCKQFLIYRIRTNPDLLLPCGGAGMMTATNWCE